MGQGESCRNIESSRESNVDVLVMKDHINGTKKIVWPNSEIPYEIHHLVHKDLKINFIEKAINEFNTETPVKWIPKQPNHSNWVIFKQRNKKCPESQFIGKKQSQGSQWIKLPFPTYPNSRYKLKVTCVLHEMMHVLGFHHEQARKDADYHCLSNTHKSYSHQAISIGQYDYQSVMHYGDGVGYIAKNAELSRLADSGTSFSQGDLAALRRIYGKQTLGLTLGYKLHFGEWHEKCSSKCTLEICVCGACGQHKNGLNCGYTGMSGHWSCCMNEEKESFCNPTHTGFWHMKCVNDRCTERLCYCKSCGSGCTYIGNKEHWSCCNNEHLDSKCPKSPYKVL
eukprot:206292_1